MCITHIFEKPDLGYGLHIYDTILEEDKDIGLKTFMLKVLDLNTFKETDIVLSDSQAYQLQQLGISFTPIVKGKEDSMILDENI